MNRWLAFGVAALLHGLGLAACGSQMVTQGPGGEVAPLVIQDEPGERQDGGQPRLMTMRLTLGSPEDLRVSQGDAIAAGDTLSDRSRDRQRIQRQLDRLHLSLEQLDRVQLPQPQTRPVADLPPVSFAEQLRGIERQQHRATAAAQAVMIQQEKLAALEDLPDLPPAVFDHEQVQLARVQEAHQDAIAELALAEARLNSARQQRAYQEYQHAQAVAARALEVERQQLQAAQQYQEVQFSRAQLLQQIGVLEGEMEILESVQAPFAGEVRRVQWIGQNDQTLTVELSVAVAADDSGAGDRQATLP